MTNKSTSERLIDYSVPKYQMASIYKGLKRLAKLIHKLPFSMTAENKRIYGDRIINRVLDCIENFVIAYDFQDERPHYYMKLTGNIHVVMSLMDEIVDEHILIPQAHKVDSEGHEVPNSQDKLVIRIYDEIGKIDTDMGKWRPSAICSKSGQ